MIARLGKHAVTLAWLSLLAVLPDNRLLYGLEPDQLPLIRQGQTLIQALPRQATMITPDSSNRFNSALFCYPTGCYVAIGIGLEAPRGPQLHKLSVTTSEAPSYPADIAFRVLAGTFPEERFTVPESYITFNDTVVKRVRREQARMRTILSRREPPMLFNTPFTLPLEGSVTAAFGARRYVNDKSPSRHRGVDLRCAQGDPVRSIQQGTVLLTGDYHINGRVVVINHGDGIFSSYSHLSSIQARTGQSVSRGEVIGACGATGRVTGPHLHLSLSIGTTGVDPLDFIKKSAAVASP